MKPEPDASRPGVAIYRTQILPLSETFVRDQALALRRWRPVLIGERTISKLPLMGLPTAALHDGPPTLAQRTGSVLLRRAGVPSPGILRRARRADVRLIHAHFGFDGVEAWPVARRLGLPLLVTLHGSDITTRTDWFASGQGGRRWRRYPDRLAALARDRRVFFIAVSENIREAALRAGLPAARLDVYRLGINVSQFAPAGAPIAGRAPIILFVGRLVEKKGAHLLIEAFARLANAVPEAQLVLAGDGPQRAQLQAQAAGRRNVRFLGAIPHEEVLAQMHRARVFCLPSVTAANGDAEGLPLVVLEAQACGVPVVTSARGGATEGMLDGRTGYAFAEHDVAALEQRLHRLLTDDALASSFAEAAPRYVAAQHDVVAQTARLEELYDRLAGEAR